MKEIEIPLKKIIERLIQALHKRHRSGGDIFRLRKHIDHGYIGGSSQPIKPLIVVSKFVHGLLVVGGAFPSNLG